ncbi:MAG: DNA polymerase III subunit beta, partial [Pirellulales bacterium]|nr:DNA polymerase III subunit beta [Pirellulales bacterium]
MDVICERAALLDAVNLVSAVTPTRTPTPQLSCVRLTAQVNDGVGELTLAGADGENSLEVTLSQVDVKTPGDTLAPADKLRQIISTQDSDSSITLRLADEQLHIEGENAHFRVFALPASEFPALPEFAKAAAGEGADPAKLVLSLEAGDLTDLISRTVFATARETSRYAINGVLVNRDAKRLEFVATDGRRLAIARHSLAADAASSDETISAIIPTKALNLVNRLVDTPEDPVRIALGATRAYFAFDSLGQTDAMRPRAVLSTALVEGQFPPYQEVIPRDQNRKIVLERGQLTSAVRKASVLTNEESRGVRMGFTADSKTLRLTSRAPEMGEA